MLESLGRLRPVRYLNPAVRFTLGTSELLLTRRLVRACVYIKIDLCAPMFSSHSIYQAD